MTKQEFIDSIAKYVRKYAKQYGICVHSPIIAQAILESGWGQSKLAAQYHNYFGLKCGTKWTGKSVNMATKEEYKPGVLTDIRDNFRVFDSMKDGVKGYFEFIQLERYHNLRGITDPKKYFETIIKDGYATSSTYVENCMALLDQYKLTQYDKEEAKMRYYRNEVVDLANSWVGRNEADGTHKYIIDIYNKYSPLPRNTKMQYNWAWCACTWSALAIKLGYTAIMPIEISCFYIIEAAKKMNIWQENDAYVPNIGDAILYDWDDSGSGNNKGNPDHIGTVVYVNRDSGYMVVVEGNYSNAVKKRTIMINGRFIRGFICPKYSGDGAAKPSTPVQSGGKDIATVAREVIAGQWGNGDARKNNLKAAGYDYNKVQAKVNKILSGKDIKTVAREVIAGQWGNGDARKKNLKAAGYNYKEVQDMVNQILNGSAVQPSTPTQPQEQPTSKKVVAGAYADKFNKSLAGTYKTTANLYMRHGAGTNKKSMVLIPNGTKVKCYGYYSVSNGVKWLYIQVTIDGVQYTGFSSSAYLKRV